MWFLFLISYLLIGLLLILPILLIVERKVKKRWILIVVAWLLGSIHLVLAWYVSLVLWFMGEFPG